VKQFFLSIAGAALVWTGSSVAQTDRGGKSSAMAAHYLFDTDPGGTARDLSGAQNNGKILKARFIERAEGRNCLRFDASSIIQCGDATSLQLQGDTTVELWVRQNEGNISDPSSMLFGQEPDGNLNLQLAYRHNLFLWYRSRAGEEAESMVIPIERETLTSTWTHLAIVLEYPRCRVYRDGKMIRDALMPIPFDSGGKKKSFFIGNSKGRTFPMDLAEFRLYRRALGAGEIAAHFAGDSAPPKVSAELEIEPDWYKDLLRLKLTAKAGAKADQQVKWTITDATGTVLATREALLVDVSENGSGRLSAASTTPLAKWKDKSLRITGELGGSFAPITKDMEIKKPDWVLNREGYPQGVPAPWSPVTVDRKEQAVKLGVWDRFYEFGPGLFPRQIESGGVALLEAPIRLNAVAGGKAITWENDPVKVVKSQDASATIEQTAKSGDLSIKLIGTLEYDGFFTFECELTAARPVSLERLALEVPFAPNRAELCHGIRVFERAPGVAMSDSFSGTVREDLSFMFSPSLWLGDDARGLCWQAESDEDWHNAKPKNAIQIQRKNGAKIFTANFVDQPVALEAGQKLRYKFALLATPVKPLSRDAWALRIARSEPYGADLDLPDRKINGKPALEYYAGLGVRYIFTNASDIWPWPMPRHKPYIKALQELVKAGHAAGLKIYPYLIHQRFPVVLPEFDGYGRQIASRPVRQYVQNGTGEPPRPGPVAYEYGADSQGTVFTAPKSQPAQDAYIYSLAQRLREYGDDGVYLDGTVHITPDKNLEIGSGYVRDGKVCPTYAVFGIREFMRRIYTVVKERSPDGIVDAHCSFGYNPSALAYADVMWTGEQWHHLKGVGAPHVASELTLDRFRTEFTGRQIGIAAEVLTYRLGSPSKIAATSLLHDISPRYSTGAYDTLNQKKEPFVAMIPKLWALRDQFGAQDAQKLFYYENQDYVTVTPNDCHATILQHPKNGSLVFIANLSKQAQTVDTAFNLKKLGLVGEQIEAVNPLAGEVLPLAKDGKLSTPLGSEEWLYVWLRPKKS
jgi:hypothetical protein